MNDFCLMKPVLEIRLPSESARCALRTALGAYLRMARADFLVLGDLMGLGLFGDRARAEASRVQTSLGQLGNLLGPKGKSPDSLHQVIQEVASTLALLDREGDCFEVSLEKTAPALVQALELYVRIGTGQFEAIVDWARLGALVERGNPESESAEEWLERMESAEDLLNRVKAQALGLTVGSSWSIQGKIVHRDFPFVWALVKSLREQILLHSRGATGF